MIRVVCYTCGRCGETFCTELDEEEARAELASRSPDLIPEECVLLCDGCHREVLEEEAKKPPQLH